MTYSDVSSAELDVSEVPSEEPQHSNLLSTEVHGNETSETPEEIIVEETIEYAHSSSCVSNGSSVQPSQVNDQQDHSQMEGSGQGADKQAQTSAASSEALISEDSMNRLGDWVKDI